MSKILSKPYAERRLVLIAPETKEQVRESPANWDFIIRSSISAQSHIFGDARKVLKWIIALEFWPYLGLYKLIKSLFSDDAPPQAGLHGALLIDCKTAAAELQLPPGHPLVGHAYAGHPLSPPRYMPAAAFHRQLFEEKVNELLTLLASLGATRVRVSCRQGYKAAGGIGLGVAKGASASVGVEGSKSSTSAAEFEEHFRPSGEPKLHDNPIWFGHEPSWQAVADRRLKFNTSKFRAELRYEDSFGIDAKMKVGIEKLGINLGGHFTDFESTVWEFEGEFA